MNCAECRDEMVAWAEGCLPPGDERQCQAHLQTCAACRAEYEAITRLQQRLLRRGQAAAGVDLVGPVRQRLRQPSNQTERETTMSKLMKHRWGFGLGAAAASVLLAFILLALPNGPAKADEILTQAAQAAANLTTIHLRGQVRTAPQDNFSYINADLPFSSIELWKQFGPNLKWRVEKPERVVVMDGQTTAMLINGNMGVKLPQRTTSAYDTEWLHRIANLSNTLSNELANARAKGWKLTLATETGADGQAKSVVTILVKSGVPDNDYVKNTFMDNADTRRVYHFDAQSKLLESVQIYLTRPAGEVQIFDLTQIDYNQPLDAKLWQLELPADVSWAQEPQKLPDNDKYAAMTAEQAARAFFEACGRKDWEEAGKFYSPINEQFKQGIGGLEIISLGEAFTSKNYPGKFVPYEIKLPPQEFYMRVANDNPGKRFVMKGVYDSQKKLMQEIKWTAEPAALTNNEFYARLAPKEAVRSYFDAQSKLDWAEMGKFTSEADVAETQAQVQMMEQNGQDVHKQLPVVEVGEAVWVPEQSAWYVQCRMAGNKMWNLAVRKDNPAGRWQVDGGF
jgi:hypothetical protein